MKFVRFRYKRRRKEWRRKSHALGKPKKSTLDLGKSIGYPSLMEILALIGPQFPLRKKKGLCS